MPPNTSTDAVRCARVCKGHLQHTRRPNTLTTHASHAQQPPCHRHRTRAHNPCPAFIPSTEDVAKQLAEKDAIIAAQAKEIEDLSQQLANVKVKAEPTIVGLYGNKEGTIVRRSSGSGKAGAAAKPRTPDGAATCVQKPSRHCGRTGQRETLVREAMGVMNWCTVAMGLVRPSRAA